MSREELARKKNDRHKLLIAFFFLGRYFRFVVMIHFLVIFAFNVNKMSMYFT